MFEHYGFMGSWSTCFIPCECGWCQQTSFANPPGVPCPSCGNKLFATLQLGTTVARHFERTLSIPQYIIRLIVEYLYWHDPDAEFRRQYLLNKLLTRGSEFRLLTYFHNGIHGNISQCEDIIDKVLLFVVGECQDRVVFRTVSNIMSNAVW